jgi:hypothetical protein
MGSATEQPLSLAFPQSVRDCDSLLNRPRQFGANKARAKNFFRHASCSRQVSERQSFAPVLEPNVRDAVVSLLLLCRPTAVARFISSIIIDAVERGLILPFAHICQKILKRAPALANGYSSFPVVSEGRGRWLRAARDHVLPGAECRASLSPGSMSMRWGAKDAAARFRVAAIQGVCRCLNGLSTRTFALPPSSLVSWRHTVDDGEFSKDFACQIGRNCHVNFPLIPTMSIAYG